MKSLLSCTRQARALAGAALLLVAPHVAAAELPLPAAQLESAAFQETPLPAASAKAVKPLGRAYGRQQGDVPQFTPLGGSAAKNSIYLLALVFVGLSLYKKLRPGKHGPVESQALEVIARKGLGGRSALLLISVEGRKVLLAQSGESVELLTTLDPAPDFADALSDLSLPEEQPEALPRVA